MATRPYREQDRELVTDLLGDARAVDGPGHRLHVADEGGVGLWVEPDGGLPHIGAVVVAKGADRRVLYQLAAACCREAIERGHKRGAFRIINAALLARLRRDFDIEVEATGWEPNSERAVEWEIEVDLVDALAQLERFV